VSLALLSAVVGLTLLQIILHAPALSTGLTSQVQNSLPHSGVTNPVTAVLLNFRGYDTLLEIAVLLLAAFGVWSLASPTASSLSSSWSPTAATPMLVGLVRVLLPIMLLISAYLLWLGAFAPGGAFQGGAVLAAGGLLLLLSNKFTSTQVDKRLWRFLLVFGFGVFLIVAVGVMPLTGHLLAYPSGQAGGLIFLIEATLTVSIACILITLFTGGPSR
jgi:multisubunit Na+/H+ antiporter MnhB subunit